MAEPRILLWDIETTHNLAAVFRLGNDDYIPHDNVVQERYIVTAAYKWLDKPAVHAVSVLDDPRRYKRNPHDDYHGRYHLVIQLLCQMFIGLQLEAVVHLQDRLHPVTALPVWN